MADKGYDSAAVVDDLGKIIANISTVDLKVFSLSIQNYCNSQLTLQGIDSKKLCYFE